MSIAVSNREGGWGTAEEADMGSLDLFLRARMETRPVEAIGEDVEGAKANLKI